MKEIRIGNIITDKRKEKQLTQDELAQYMGVTEQLQNSYKYL